MDRREALKYTASVMGVSILGAEAFLSGCTSTHDRNALFSSEDIQLLDEIGETILPESEKSPGAKAARIGEFMKAIVTDCYSAEDQKVFQLGLGEVQQASREKYALDFLQLTPQGRLELLSEFDRQARAHNSAGQTHFFAMMKQLIIWGFFSSEPGVTQAMRYDPIPGGYNGCVAYNNGDKAWYGPLSSIG